MRHASPFEVYCVPAACAPALAATFPDAFAPHPGPKTSGHPAWPGATPGLTPDKPEHTHARTYTNTHINMHTDIHAHIHHSHGNTQSHPTMKPVREIDMAPHTHKPTHTHPQIDTSVHTHPPREKKKGGEETEIVGLPQQHYSNAQGLLLRERRQRERQMSSKEKRKQSADFYSILIWHATSTARCVLRQEVQPYSTRPVTILH